MKRLIDRTVRRALRRVRGDNDLDDFRRAGAVIADSVLANGLRINKNDCFLVTIEESVVFGPDVLILAHDASLRPELGYTRIAPVYVGRGSFIGARATILAGSNIGSDCIIAAGSVVSGNLEPGSVYGGVPARRLGSKTNHLAKWEQVAEHGPQFNEGWKLTLGRKEGRETMRDAIGDGNGWVY